MIQSCLCHHTARLLSECTGAGRCRSPRTQLLAAERTIRVLTFCHYLPRAQKTAVLSPTLIADGHMLAMCCLIDLHLVHELPHSRNHLNYSQHTSARPQVSVEAEVPDVHTTAGRAKGGVRVADEASFVCAMTGAYRRASCRVTARTFCELVSSCTPLSARWQFGMDT